MGIVDTLARRHQAIPIHKVAFELRPMLFEGERAEMAFKVFSDVHVFTDRRLISIERYGFTGKETVYRSLPYNNIMMFSQEPAGMFDLDEELKLWIKGLAEPLRFSFTENGLMNQISQCCQGASSADRHTPTVPPDRGQFGESLRRLHADFFDHAGQPSISTCPRPPGDTWLRQSVGLTSPRCGPGHTPE